MLGRYLPIKNVKLHFFFFLRGDIADQANYKYRSNRLIKIRPYLKRNKFSVGMMHTEIISHICVYK